MDWLAKQVRDNPKVREEFRKELWRMRRDKNKAARVVWSKRIQKTKLKSVK